ncbi:hypothetical protein DICPUDRAFT_150753 [Dictyostelium purpureum]|uniref:Calcineurin-like phosphoesterase domain-containing protein n=1 Tax=Dictyostelium purpureum TaxID=5786 RepID=F0ZH61_DICPU|nr:uncharacterized protein DICPUDRAFT_150753 [Dictyostelium purpureum]EGC36738.1 hypothetical protein DICPUDRAFT_150753 [Dictyostelium purpureum]|eukprot:XP_003286763.1 hypothetical protein DICPUDRAFT_150753 [Dictyostelium purpureum]
MFLQNKKIFVLIILSIIIIKLVDVTYSKNNNIDLPSKKNIYDSEENNGQNLNSGGTEEFNQKNIESSHIGAIYDVNNKPILKYNKDNKFKIVQFTDLHYGEEEVFDELNVKVEEAILDFENPDFVMLSGDIVSGYKYHKKKNYTDVWDLVTGPMIKRGIPWAITFGNHDCEGFLTCKKIAEIDMSYNLSLTQINPTIGLPGVTNYHLNIFPYNYNGKDSSDSSKAQSIIYIFDSDTPGCRNNEVWGCIQKPQVEWYKNLSNTNNKKDAIAFVHIPPYEVVDLWNHGTVYGSFQDSEICCYYTDESKFIDTFIEQGDVKGLYFGHDHGNDYHGDYHGIDLGYGRKSGYGSYNTKFMQGSRVLELTAEPYKIDSWIRDFAGIKDTQKIHKPNFFDQYEIICCIPGDIRSKPYFPHLISLIAFIVGGCHVGFIICYVL